jgi:hypothetical protein
MANNVAINLRTTPFLQREEPAATLLPNHDKAKIITIPYTDEEGDIWLERPGRPEGEEEYPVPPRVFFKVVRNETGETSMANVIVYIISRLRATLNLRNMFVSRARLTMQVGFDGENNLITAITFRDATRDLLHVYGEWDASGPRMVIKMNHHDIPRSFKRIFNYLIHNILTLDDSEIGKNALEKRIDTYKNDFLALDTAHRKEAIGKPAPDLSYRGDGRAALPENILRNVVGPMVVPGPKDPVASLSRLVKGGLRRGRVTRKQKRRRGSQKKTRST